MDKATNGHKRREVSGWREEKRELKCKSTGHEIKTERQRKESGTKR